MKSGLKLTDYTNSHIGLMKGIREQFEPDLTVIANLERLDEKLTAPIKEKFPKIEITSGYRCDKVNKLVGGRENSQHKKGQAIDLRCYQLNKLWEYITRELDFDQAIKYKNFIHVSYVDDVSNRNQIIYKWKSIT